MCGPQREAARVGAGPGPRLGAPPPQASPRQALERYFHAVVAAVEQMACEPSPSREGHLERLEEIYCSLLGPAAAARGRCGGKRAGPPRARRGRQRARCTCRAGLRRAGPRGAPGPRAAQELGRSRAKEEGWAGPDGREGLCTPSGPLGAAGEGRGESHSAPPSFR